VPPLVRPSEMWLWPSIEPQYIITIINFVFRLCDDQNIHVTKPSEGSPPKRAVHSPPKARHVTKPSEGSPPKAEHIDTPSEGTHTLNRQGATDMLNTWWRNDSDELTLIFYTLDYDVLKYKHWGGCSVDPLFIWAFLTRTDLSDTHIQ
jgi:hypothetical protein